MFSCMANWEYELPLTEKIRKSYRHRFILIGECGRTEIEAIPPHTLRVRNRGDFLKSEESDALDWYGIVIMKIRMANGMKK